MQKNTHSFNQTHGLRRPRGFSGLQSGGKKVKYNIDKYIKLDLDEGIEYRDANLIATDIAKLPLCIIDRAPTKHRASRVKKRPPK